MPKAGSNKVITKSTEDPFWCDGGREKAPAHYLAAEPRRQLYSRAPWEVSPDQAGLATVVEALSQFIKTHLLPTSSLFLTSSAVPRDFVFEDALVRQTLEEA